MVKHVSKLTNGLGEYWTELGLDTRVLGDLDWKLGDVTTNTLRYNNTTDVNKQQYYAYIQVMLHLERL